MLPAGITSILEKLGAGALLRLRSWVTNAGSASAPDDSDASKVNPIIAAVLMMGAMIDSLALTVSCKITHDGAERFHRVGALAYHCPLSATLR